ncbi:hypothetical protein E2562_013095 [Oryza meyeriana var. granulata]|uniref:Uncharacterized protein n=1 Tax=Oryza meyeriana var. granulata TaxID=110450 RepID=A0A6G1F7S1_9ORYZ|nr:hypothetical protein E2562_013095 [Oryza meyeriana var. granulata]
MVLRSMLSPGKLQKKWEGPFIVTRASANGAYRLAELDGMSLLHVWNAEALKNSQGFSGPPLTRSSGLSLRWKSDVGSQNDFSALHSCVVVA